MAQPTSTDSEKTARPRVNTSGSSNQAISHAPLVIVSEGGRHSEESRRLVRAQAARASAAQSRVTRARNRGERDGTSRDDLILPSNTAPPASTQQPQYQHPPTSGTIASSSLDAWLSKHWKPPGVSHTVGLTSPEGHTLPNDRRSATNAPATAVAYASSERRLQLPAAIPSGFLELQRRTSVCKELIELTGRTACFDYVSVGVEARLVHLLQDLISHSMARQISFDASSDRSIESYICIACICLTLFQGQRTGGPLSEYRESLAEGLASAWHDARALNSEPLLERHVAEAALWAVFMIVVTTGAPLGGCPTTSLVLLERLQLGSWAVLREMLLGFVFPVSFMDLHCQALYDTITRTRRLS